MLPPVRSVPSCSVWLDDKKLMCWSLSRAFTNNSTLQIGLSTRKQAVEAEVVAAAAAVECHLWAAAVAAAAVAEEVVEAAAGNATTQESLQNRHLRLALYYL